MAEAVYLLCAVTSLACAVLLLRGYFRNRMRLSLWTALCFVGMAGNNVLLFVDLVMVPGIDFSIWRHLLGIAGTGLLLYGMIASDGARR
jgi:hypothetical protein